MIGKTTIPFGKFKGWTFDQLFDLDTTDPDTGLPFRGVTYLDWLWGQSWIYGNFRERLGSYLSQPHVQRVLDSLLPEEWDDSDKPLFVICECNLSCKVQAGRPEARGFGFSWNPPKEETPPRKPSRVLDLWSKAADWLLFFETVDSLTDALTVDYAELKELCKRLPASASAKLRNAYRSMRDRIRSTRDLPVGNVYRALELGVSDFILPTRSHR